MTRTKGASNISPTVATLIKEMAVDQKKKDRGVLAIELTELLNRQGELPPARDTIEKMISEARNHSDPLDGRWSLATSRNREFSLPPESIPTVLKVFVEHTNKFGKPFTIRQAMWVARLYILIKDPEELAKTAIQYAGAERIGALLGNPDLPSSSDDLDLYSKTTYLDDATKENILKNHGVPEQWDDKYHMRDFIRSLERGSDK